MATILLIDDDDHLRKNLGEVLKHAGYDVVLAADGREGMTLFRASTPDLVITDLFMPNQEGVETIAELRKTYPNVPVIAMSGRSPAHAMLSVARWLGAVATLHKSFSADELLAAVSKALTGADNPESGTSPAS